MKRSTEGSRLYEGLFLFDPTEAGKGMEHLVKLVRDLLEKHGSEVVKLDHWGDRKLAYEINSLKRGTYLLGFFKVDPANISAMDRELRLSETVLRHMFIVHEKEPAELRPVEETPEGAAEVKDAPDATDGKDGNEKDAKDEPVAAASS